MKKALISLATALLLALLGTLFPGLFQEAPPESSDPGQTLVPGSPHTDTQAVTGDGMTVHFIDVGQADCALLECDGEFMIVDGGNIDDGQMVVSYLNQMGVERLSAVVCSHAHEDHVGGLPAVLAVYPADSVYAPVTEYSSKVFGDFVSYTEKQGLSVTVPSPGDQFSLGSARVSVLGPVQEYDDPNDTSLVLKVSYGTSDFLFTGDMETTAEADMLDYWQDAVDWNVEVLKVGHHGSDTSTSYRFLYETNPTYGVISVGTDNSYGHPHDEPMSRMRDAGLVLLRTDLLGHVIASTDGSEITFYWENQNAQPEHVEPGDRNPVIFYANKKSGTFHVDSCRNLPSEDNRVEFTDYDAVIAAGYKPCGSCIE